MKKFKVGDMVRVVKDLNPVEDEIEIKYSKKDVGKIFKIQAIDKSREYPYILYGTDWLRKADELELVDVEEVEKKEEYKQAINNLMEENKDLQEQLDYADKQLEKQAKIIEGLEDLVHELHDKLIEKIKGE